MKSGTDSSPSSSLLQGKWYRIENGEKRYSEAASPSIHSVALLPALDLRFGVARKNSRRVTHLC